METEVEHDFIRQSQKGLCDAKDYFIAGSAYRKVIGPFIYTTDPYDLDQPSNAYSQIQSGNVIRTKDFHFLNDAITLSCAISTIIFYI